MKHVSIALVLIGFCLIASEAPAADINCPISDDGYLPAGMGPGWYWTREYSKSYNNYSGFFCYGMVKPNLSPLAGMTSADVESARLLWYVTDKQGMGPDPYPDNGMIAQFTLNAYDDTVMLTESVVHPNRPGYVPGTTLTVDHSGFTNWASADVTDIVRSWVDGDYVNNGIELFDTAADDFSWYWNTKEAATGNPYLMVKPVPEPATILLLGTGVLGVLGHFRRRRMK